MFLFQAKVRRGLVDWSNVSMVWYLYLKNICKNICNCDVQLFNTFQYCLLLFNFSKACKLIHGIIIISVVKQKQLSTSTTVRFDQSNVVDSYVSTWHNKLTHNTPGHMIYISSLCRFKTFDLNKAIELCLMIHMMHSPADELALVDSPKEMSSNNLAQLMPDHLGKYKYQSFLCLGTIFNFDESSFSKRKQTNISRPYIWTWDWDWHDLKISKILKSDPSSSWYKPQGLNHKGSHVLFNDGTTRVKPQG